MLPSCMVVLQNAPASLPLDSAGALLQVMVTKNRLPLVYDKSRPARFGVIPKRPKSGKEVRWFELDPGQPAVVLCLRPASKSLSACYF